VLGALAALGLAPADPARHLPHLAGEFLVVGGDGDDALVPVAASRRMAALAPEPKTIERLPGGHVGGETAATRRLVAAARAWLGARGALAP
jgi:hypothetical protein